MIAIIGKSGVGKTTLLNILEARGFKTFIADNYVKNIYKKGSIGYKKIQEILGDQYVNEYEVDKKALRDSIIQDYNFVDKLEKIIYPIIEDHLKNHHYDFAEVPNIYTSNGNFVPLFNKIIRIETSEKIRLKNLKKRNVNNLEKNVIDTLNKGFFNDKVVNIWCTKVTTKKFLKKIFEIFFTAS
ncbi:dephospho-CoA kinase [[Mycoplasma] gypis]|uniref:Dephospho-CoA kinase n=1 Tax=[Mycoplasma] gypis TaxID=92404 RepID=A0ABZ2RQT2_9BACT|nr:dephospho-CoA kinase [[Mycoplasma] gypis]MBN0919636.1 dephospho-CoA kinase [[Mycoplasma] gypis]